MNNQFREISLADVGIVLLASAFRRCQPSRTEEPSQQQQSYDDLVTASSFERLLYWLDPDSHSAGRKYESIRARLIVRFRARGCMFAEDLADVTFERVARRVANLTPSFTGDPAPYFFGVAKKIYLEHRRELKANELKATCWQPTSVDNPDAENMFELLEKALSMIPNADRELILKYYAWNGKSKIDHRRAFANELGIGLNALRLRAFRIRREIKKNMVQLDAELMRKYLRT